MNDARNDVRSCTRQEDGSIGRNVVEFIRKVLYWADYVMLVQKISGGL